MNRFKVTSVLWILALVALLAAVSVQAEPMAGSEDLYQWTAASAEEQLAAEGSVIPAGKGAIFVPAMTAGQDEPQVLVFSGEDRMASGETGERIAVDPGSYTVYVGSGATKQATAAEVTVVAGDTSVVDATWGGLVIEVVDESNIPHRGTYEVIRVADRELYGLGYGAETLEGDRLPTWLLPAGLYRIVRPGETYRARRDFATVDIPEGGLVFFKLVLNPQTGDFRGGGVVLPEDIGVVTGGDEASPWTQRLTLGMAGSISRSADVVGAPNQTAFAGNAFFDGLFTYRQDQNFASIILEYEAGAVQVKPEQGDSLPWQKSQDRLRVDGLYTRFLTERVGPYVRLGFITNVFVTDVLTTEDITVRFNQLDGSSRLVAVPASDSYRVSDAFGSLRVREGVGANFRLFRNEYATISVRGGVGLRQNIFNNVFIQNDDPSTPEIEYFEADDFNQEGLETTLTGTARLTRTLLYITDLELFGDFDDFGDPTIDWRNTLSLRLSRYLSLDYRLDVLELPQLSDETQVTQNLLLRVSFDIL